MFSSKFDAHFQSTFLQEHLWTAASGKKIFDWSNDLQFVIDRKWQEI